MNQRSRSTLFLIEQLIVVAVFAICSAACVRILTSAYTTARDSRDISNAVLIAESAAESYKAFSGDIGKVAEILGGVNGKVDSTGAAIVYYDKHWRVCGTDDAFYAFHLFKGQPDAQPSPFLMSGEILVERLSGEQLVTFKIAAHGN